MFINLLKEEFLAYQAMSGNKISQHVWELAKVNKNVDEGKAYYRMDIVWVNFRTNLPTLGNGGLQALTHHTAMLLKNESFQ